MKRVFFSLVVTGTAAFLFLIGSFVQPVSAQDGQAQRLQQKIEELENRVQELEANLKVCIERRMADKAKDSAWQNKKNWRKLEMGMPQKQVEAILGEPVKIISGYRTLWYYPNIYCGYVSFDNSGNLTGWSEP